MEKGNFFHAILISYKKNNKFEVYCLLYKVLQNLNIFPELNKNCSEWHLGPLHRSYTYIYTDENYRSIF